MMFSRKLKLFRLFGFEVGIDPSWVVLAILVAWSLSTGYFPFKYQDLAARQYWIMGILGAVGLFVSIVAHEFSHSLVARRSGLPMKGITLFIFGGVAEMEGEPARPRDELWIALAGPGASFAMAGLFYGLSMLTQTVGALFSVSAVSGYLGFVNLVLALFNLVPAFPLDGGRVLRAALWAWKDNLKWATRVASRAGEGFGLLLIILGIMRILSGYFIGGMWFFLIGMFVRSAAQLSFRQLMTRRALEGESLQRFMNEAPVTVAPEISLERLVEDYIYRFHHKLFPVVQDGRLVGCITTRQVKEVPREQWARTRVGDLVQACSEENTIGPESDAVQALAAMHRSDAGRLMVVRGERLLGIIALKDLLHFLSLKIELEQA
ncbi:MAG: site-2 protease family protein [Desulfobacterales bacterium]